eukprot:COSAG02_NODE_23660_length_711_cov_2.143791_1_plen_116_part_00
MPQTRTKGGNRSKAKPQSTKRQRRASVGANRQAAGRTRTTEGAKRQKYNDDDDDGGGGGGGSGGGDDYDMTAREAPFAAAHSQKTGGQAELRKIAAPKLRTSPLPNCTRRPVLPY